MVKPIISGSSHRWILRDTADYDEYEDLVGQFTATDADGDTITFTFSGSAAPVAGPPPPAEGEEETRKQVATDDAGRAVYATHSALHDHGTIYYNENTGHYRFVHDLEFSNSFRAGFETGKSFRVTAFAGGEESSNTRLITQTIFGANDRPLLDNIIVTFQNTVDTDDFQDQTGRFGGRDVDLRTRAGPMPDTIESYTVTLGGTAATSDTTQEGFTHSIQGVYGKLFFDRVSGRYKYEPDDTKINALSADGNLDVFTVTASDGDLDSAERTLTFAVAIADSPPVFTTVPTNLRIAENQDGSETAINIGGRFVATDANGDAITYSLRGAPDYFEIDETTGQLRYWGLGLDYEALSLLQRNPSFTVIATANGQTAEQIVTVAITDVAEAVGAFPNQAYSSTLPLPTPPAGVTYVLQAVISTPEEGNPRVVTQTGWLSFDADTYTISGTPRTSDIGREFSIRIRESTTASNEYDYEYFVFVAEAGSAPIFSDISFNLPINSATTLLGDLEDDDYLQDRSSFEIFKFNFAASVSPTIRNLFSIRDGELYFQGTAADTATAGTSWTFDVVVRDFDGLEDTATITVRVVQIQLGDIATTTPFRDTTIDDAFDPITGTFSVAGGQLGQAHTFAIPNARRTGEESGFTHAVDGKYGTLFYHANSINGILMVGTGGAYKYVPNDYAINKLAAGATDTDVFSVTVADGVTTSTAKTLTITVMGADDPLTLPDIPARTIQDTGDDDDFPNQFGFIRANDDGQAVTFSIVTPGQNIIADDSRPGFTHRADGTYGTLVYNSGTGGYKYIPKDAVINALSTGQSGTDNFSVTVTDGTTTSTAKTLTFNIIGANEISLRKTIRDTAVNDGFADIDGVFTLEIGQNLAVAGSMSENMIRDVTQLGFTHRADGTYGQLFYNSGTGAYKYVPNDVAINALTADDRVSEIFTATRQPLNLRETLTITIIGADEDSTAGTIRIIQDTALYDDFPNTWGQFTVPTSETITVRLKNGQTGFATTKTEPNDDGVTISFTHTINGVYGKFFYNENTGDYWYRVNDAAVNALAEGARGDDVFTTSLSSSDTIEILRFSVRGADDVTTVTLQDTSANDDLDNIWGQFEVDTGETLTVRLNGGTGFATTKTEPNDDGVTISFTHTINGVYGKFFYNENTGVYWYRVNDAAVNALAEGASGTDTLTTSLSSSRYTQTLIINVVGARDGDTHTIQDTGANDDFPNIWGQFHIPTDETITVSRNGLAGFTTSQTEMNDQGETISFTHTLNTAYGKLSYNENTGVYWYRVADAAVNRLADGATASDIFTTRLSSSSYTETLTINVIGADEGATITLQDTGAADDFPDTWGQFVVELGDRITVSLNGQAGSRSSRTETNNDGQSISFTHVLTGAYGTLYYNDRTGDYKYDANNEAINALADGATASDIFTTRASFSSYAETLTINVRGATEEIRATIRDTAARDDFADIWGQFTIETGETISVRLSDGGAGFATTKTETNPDGQLISFTHTLNAAYGKLFYVESTGVYWYRVNDIAVNDLAGGESAFDTFTITRSTGPEEILKIEVIGADGDDNTAPVLTTPIGTHTIVDSIDPNTRFSVETGRFTATDSDTGDTITYSVQGAALIGTDADGELVTQERVNPDSAPNAILATHSATATDTTGTITYGILYFHSGEGYYKFIPNAATINALTSNARIVFQVTANDGNGGSDTESLTIDITAADRPPELETIAVRSISDGPGIETFEPLTGTFSATDPNGDTIRYIVSNAQADTSEDGFTHRVDSLRGTLFYNEDTGAYKYLVDDLELNRVPEPRGRDYSAVNFFSVTAEAGGRTSARQTLRIELVGVNEDAFSKILIDTSAPDNLSNEWGDFTISQGETIAITLSDGTAASPTTETEVRYPRTAREVTIQFTHSIEGDYVTLFYVESTGVYWYRVKDAAINALADGARDSDIFTITPSGTTDAQTLTFAVYGAEDRPSLTSRTEVIFDTIDTDDFPDVTGTFADLASDPEGEAISGYFVPDATADTSALLVPAGTNPVANPAIMSTHSLADTYGTLFYNTDTGDYKYVPNDAAIDALTTDATDLFFLYVTTGTGADTSYSRWRQFRINLEASLESDEVTFTGIDNLEIAENQDGRQNPISIGTILATREVTTQDDDDNDVTTTTTALGYRLIGAPAGFEIVSGININGGEIRYTGLGLDYDTENADADPTISFIVEANFANRLAARTTVTITVTDADDAPTALSLSATSLDVAENSGAMKLADITITDADGGTNTLTLSDTTRFEIRTNAEGGQELWLSASANLDYEDITARSHTVNIGIEGTSLTQTFTLGVTDADDAPTAFSLSRASLTVSESVTFGENTGERQLASISFTDVDATTNEITLSGANANLFEIRDSGGAVNARGNRLWLKESAELDFETAPTVTVDGTQYKGYIVNIGIAGTTLDTQTFTLIVADADDAPTAISLSATSLSVAENNDAMKLADITVADVDGGASRAILTDTTRFEIRTNAEGGQELWLKGGALDYETTPTIGATTARGYIVNVIIQGTTITQDFTLTVTDVVNEDQILTLSRARLDVAENSGAMKLADITITDPQGRTNTLILEGAQKARFEIRTNAEGGQELWLSDSANLDYEVPTARSLTVRVAIDGTEISQSFTLGVTNVDEDPTALDLSRTSLTVAEDSSEIKLADITITDADGGANTLTLSAGDAQGFTIDATSGQISYAGNSLDFETAPTITLTIVARSSSTGNPETQQVVEIAITDVYEAPAPTFDTVPYLGLAENRDGSGTGNAIDVGDPVTATAGDASITYTLSGQPAGFDIDGATGQIQYTGTGFDYEALTAEQRQITFTVIATESLGNLQTRQQVTINVVNQGPTFTVSATTLTLAEDTDGTTTAITIATVTASDPENAGASYTYSILSQDLLKDGEEVENVSASGFRIDRTTGQITYEGNSLDYEEADVVELTIRAVTQGGPEGLRVVRVSVTDVDEAPVFAPLETVLRLTADTDGSSDAIPIGTVTATDPEGDAITYTIQGDAQGFAIGATTGQITYTGTGISLQGGTPTLISLTIAAGTADNEETTQTITIAVLPPAQPGFTIAENADGSDTAIPIGTFTASPDPDNPSATFTYSILEQTPLKDAAAADDEVSVSGFRIDGTTGQITYEGDGLNYEDSDAVELTIRIVQSVGENSQAVVRVSVTNVNEAPEFTPRETVFTLVANTDGSGTAIPIGTVSAPDPEGDTVTYMIQGNAQGFAIGETTGQITYEGSGISLQGGTPAIVSLTIVATATGGSTTETVQIAILSSAVQPLGDPVTPTFAAVPNDLTLAENQAGSEVAPINVGSPVTATAGGAAITYSLSGQPTGFTIDAATGQIRYEGPAFNYEALTAAQRQITFTVTATEARGDMQASQQVTISITDVNEVPTQTTAPIFNTLPTDLTLAEDTDGTGAGGPIAVGSPVTAADQAGGTVTYRIVGDATYFEIRNGNELWLRAGTVLDYDTQSSLTVQIAIDGTSFTQTFTLNVADFTLSRLSSSVSENQGAVKLADIEIADDTLSGKPITLSGDDATLFEIRNTNELWLKESAELDFEDAQEHTVRISIQDATRSYTFTLGVINANEAPVLTVNNPATAIVDTAAADDFTQSRFERTGTFTATDADRDAQGNPIDTITYSVAKGDTVVAEHTSEILVEAGDDPVANPAIMSTHSIAGTYGTLYYNANTGNYKYKPTNNAALNALDTAGGSETFQVTANDGSDNSAPQTLTISFTGADDTPTGLSLDNPSVTVSENSGATQLATITITDADGGPYTLTLSGDDATLFEIRNTNELWLKADATLATTGHTVNVGIQGTPHSQTFTLGVTANVAPALVRASLARFVLADTTAADTFTDEFSGQFRATDTDNEADDITFRVRGATEDTSETLVEAGDDPVANPAIMSTHGALHADRIGTLYYNDETGHYKFVPDETVINALNSGGIPQSFAFSVSAFDGKAASHVRPLFIRITSVDDSPIVTGGTGLTIDENTDGSTSAVNIGTPIQITDAENGGAATRYSLRDAPTGFKITNAGQIYYDGDGTNLDYETANQRSNSFTVIAHFGTGDDAPTVEQSVTVNLNDLDAKPTSFTLSTTSGIAETGATSRIELAIITIVDDGEGNAGTPSLLSDAYFNIARNADGDWALYLATARTLVLGQTYTANIVLNGATGEGATPGTLTYTLNTAQGNIAPVLITPGPHIIADTPAVDTDFDDIYGRFSATDTNRDANGNPTDTIKYTVEVTVQSGGQPTILEAREVDSGDEIRVNGPDAATAIHATHFYGAGQLGVLFFHEVSGYYKFQITGFIVERLGQGETLTDSLTIIATDDGTPVLSDSETLIITATGSNERPTLNAISTPPAIVETAAADRFDADDNRLGKFSSTDPNSDTITYSVAQGDTVVAEHTSERVNAPDAATAIMSTHSLAGTYGTLYYNANTGNYKYVPTASAIDPLSANAEDEFQVTATDDDSTKAADATANLLSDTKTLTIRITAADDTATAFTVPTGLTLAENADGSATRINIGTVTATDVDGGTTFTLSGAPAGFKIDSTGQIYYDGDGTNLDYEANPTITLMVQADGLTAQAVTIAITDIDEKPTNASFVWNTATPAIIDDPSTEQKLATIYFTDDATGTNTISLSDTTYFEIRNGNELWLKPNAPFVYTANPFLQHKVTLSFTTSGTGTELADQTYTVTVNKEPTSFAIIADTTSVSEDADTTAGIKLADVTFIDDGIGTNTNGFTLSDTTRFELREIRPLVSVTRTDDDGNEITEMVPGDIARYELWLKAGTALDFETAQSHSVTLTPDVTGVDNPQLVAQTFTLAVTGDKEPTSFAIIADTTSVSEDADTTAGIKLADVTFIDDGIGTNSFTLSDTTRFELRPVNDDDGNAIANRFELWLRAGTALDFETAQSHSVTLTPVTTGVDNPQLVAQTFTLAVTDVDEAPTSFSLSSNAESVSEDSGSQMLSTITIVDDGASGGTRNVAVIVANGIIVDSDVFEIRNGNELWLKRNAEIDFETAQTYTIDVAVGIFRNPAAVEAYEAELEAALRAGTPPPAEVSPIVDSLLSAQTFTLTVTDANEAPVLERLASHTITDTGVTGETFAPITGRFTATDEDRDTQGNPIDTIEYYAAGPDTRTPAERRLNPNESPGGPIADTGKTLAPGVTSTHKAEGLYGTLYFNINSGHYLYEGDATRIDPLDDGENVAETFRVRAYSGTGARDLSSNQGFLTIHIEGADEVFDPLPTLSIAEDEDGTVTAVDVGSIRATDPTGGTISYTLAGDAQGFAIDATTGQITYAGNSLDFESAPTITLRVVARSSNGQETEQPVPITVTDVNEAPVFDGPATSPTTPPFTIDENVDASGRRDIITAAVLSATDPEDEKVGLTYSFTQNYGRDWTITTFIDRVDNTEKAGIFYRGTGLDHEATPTLSFIVQVADSDGNVGAATQTVTITVADVVEPFEFTTAPTTLSLDENVAGDVTNADITGGVFTAEYGDKPTETIRYSVTGSSDFAITADGQLQYTGAALDYEALSQSARQISLTITASVGSSVGGDLEEITASVTVNIADVEEAFGFTAAPTTLSLNENVAGTVDISGGVFTAVDTDDPTATVTYGVSGHSDFAITASGQLQYTGTGFDYEALTSQGRQISLMITASIGSGATLETETADVTVNIADVAEPLAFNPLPALTLNEGQSGRPTAIDVGTVTASDPDTAGTVMYSITDRNDNPPPDFAIDSTTGLIKYSGVELDRELTPDFPLRVVATLGEGAAQQTIQTDIIITVRDVDEDFAFVSAPASLSLNENEAGSEARPVNLIGDPFHASDPDDAGTVRYRLEGAPANYQIAVNGRIQYTGPALDYETLSESERSFTFTVVATHGDDDNPPTVRSDVTINIEDVDDAPEFGAAPTGLTLAENSDGSQGAAILIGTVTATDDEGDSIEYTLQPGAPDNFAVHRTSGEIRYTGPSLNYEALTEEQRDIALTIIATANGKTGEQTVRIMVTNIDEHDPVFDTLPTNLQLNENQDGSAPNAAIDIGSPIQARDADGHAVTYRLKAGAPANFEIDGTTGQLRYTGTGLDYESPPAFAGMNAEGDPTISFTVIATANGEETEQDVTITIANVNEGPVFEDTLMVIENVDGSIIVADDGMVIGITVGQPVIAADPDGDPVEYSLEYEDGSTPNDFRIDATSAQIYYIGGGLNHEVTDTVTITVVATDGGDGTRRPVSITVIDVNEAPTLGLHALAYHRGQTEIVLDSTHLLTTDEDATDTAEQLTYTIHSLSSVGKLQLDAAGDGTWVDIIAYATFTQADVNEGRVRYVPNDPQARTDASFRFTVADGRENGVDAVSGTFAVTVREVVDTTNPELEDRVDLDTAGTAGAKTIHGGDGVDRIRTGTGNDYIEGGLGNDEINLENNNDEADGADEIVYTFSVRNGNWVAYDGADEIRGFRRGEDKIIFQADSAEIPRITTLEQFLIAARGADTRPLTKDDQFMVRPRFEYDADGAWVVGIAFYFQDAGSYGNGKLAVGLLKIYFDERIWQDDFLDLIRTPAGDDNISRSTLAIRDLTVLPNLLGEDSIEFRTIERPAIAVNSDSERVIEDSSRSDTANGQIALDNPQISATYSLSVQFGSNTAMAIAADNTAITGTYGMFTVNQDGTWTYQLDNSNTAVNALNSGQTLTETFTFTYLGGGQTFTHTLTITVEGRTDHTITGNFDMRTEETDFVVTSIATSFIEIRTGSGDDIILLGTNNNVETVYAGGGNDEIYGDAGRDSIQGQGGNDYIDGGLGIDQISGGTGNDIFVLGVANAVDLDADVIADFTKGQDKIEVDTPTGAETTLAALRSAANIYWTEEQAHAAKSGALFGRVVENDTNDTIIWHTRGTTDTSNDIILMVLNDYTGGLAITDFEIV